MTSHLEVGVLGRKIKIFSQKHLSLTAEQTTYVILIPHSKKSIVNSEYYLLEA